MEGFSLEVHGAPKGAEFSLQVITNIILFFGGEVLINYKYSIKGPKKLFSLLRPLY